MYNLMKSIHIVSVMSWFAGLIYFGRVIIYYQEASSKHSDERQIIQAQMSIMARRVMAYISHPAMIASLISGTYLAVKYQIYKAPWFHVKLVLIICLLIYHYFSYSLVKQVTSDSLTWSGKALRIFNEILTVLMILIVFTAIYKTPKGALIGGAFIVMLTLLILLGIVIQVIRGVKN